ncbi:MAG: TonB-dependent siderophore receptor [Candidatus Protistobacter heckmanni]|nr:TonB-dependent siderophore receptor [Candidatus Protistobacter heckmanni]
MVINRELMTSQGATSLADALRNVPGITIGGAEGGQISTNINLNGFSARTDMYLDGFRDRAQYYRDLFSLDAVEVLMGPSSMLFGRGSTGGVVNQVSKSPSLKKFGEVSATVDTNGGVRTTADFNQPLSETSAFRVAMMGQDTKSTRDVTENKDFGIAPSLKFGIGTPTQFTLTALYQKNRDMPDYGFVGLNGAPLGASSKTWYGYTDDRTIQETTSLNARIDHKISPTLSMRSQTQFSQTNTNAVETSPHAIGTVGGSGFTAVTGASTLPLSSLYVQLQSHDRQIRDKSFSNQTDFTYLFDTGSIKHTLVYGGELGWDSYGVVNYARTGSCNGVTMASSMVACVPLLGSSYTTSPTSATTTLANVGTGNASTVAVYTNDTIELNKQWKLVGGLRWDRYHASLTNTVTTNAPAAAAQTTYFTSVRAGAMYQPANWQPYYLSYGTSFNPSLESLTVTNGTQAVAPESNRTHELGGKWDLLHNQLSLSAAVFQIEKSNARSQVSTGVYTLDGDVRVNGFRLGAAGNLTKKWGVYGGDTFLDGRIVSASALDATQSNIPANTPRHTLALWTTYDIVPGWQAGGGATFMSSRFAANGNTVVTSGNAIQVPSYTRFDAMLAYRQPKYDVRVNLLNVFNKQYYDSLIQSDGGRAVPGIGRTAMLTVTYRM